MIQDQSAVGRSRSIAVKVGPWVAGVLASVGLVADVDTLVGIPKVLVVGFALLVGVALVGVGAVLYGREWDKPLRLPATKGVAVIVAGTALGSFGFSGLVPGLVDLVDRSGGVPKTLRHGAAMDLDPESVRSEIDLELTRGGEDPIFEAPPSGNSVFAHVTRPSTASCEQAREWADRLKPIDGLLVCVKTDRDRYVVIEVLSVSYDLVVFRILDRDPDSDP